MTNSRREHFESVTDGANAPGGSFEGEAGGIWELPDHIADSVGGALDFYETCGGGVDFAQNFSCFAQGIGDFSSGTPPKFQQEITFNGG